MARSSRKNERSGLSSKFRILLKVSLEGDQEKHGMT